MIAHPKNSLVGDVRRNTKPEKPGETGQAALAPHHFTTSPLILCGVHTVTRSETPFLRLTYGRERKKETKKKKVLVHNKVKKK